MSGGNRVGRRTATLSFLVKHLRMLYHADGCQALVVCKGRENGGGRGGGQNGCGVADAGWRPEGRAGAAGPRSYRRPRDRRVWQDHDGRAEGAAPRRPGHRALREDAVAHLQQIVARLPEAHVARGGLRPRHRQLPPLCPRLPEVAWGDVGWLHRGPAGAMEVDRAGGARGAGRAWQRLSRPPR